MANDRYSTATAAEKANFSKFAKILIAGGILAAMVDHRRLEGSEKKGKYMFYLKKNNPGISHIEFVTNAAGDELRMRVIVAPQTKGSDFYKEITKKGQKLYGGLVINWEKEGNDLGSVLKQVHTLAEASEVISLEKVEEPKEEKTPKAKDVKTPKAEEVETPKEEAKAPLTAKEAAEQDMKSA